MLTSHVARASGFAYRFSSFDCSFQVYAESHQEHRRLQLLSRRNAASLPVLGPSPWNVGPKSSL